MPSASNDWTRLHPCPLCEAGCGLSFRGTLNEPTHVSGNPSDVFSKGFLCAKGAEILNLERDPERLTKPLRRTAGGDFQEVGWEEALDEAAERLLATQKLYGRDAVAVSMGTVTVHKYSTLLVRNALHRALRTRNFSGVISQDTGARFVSSRFLYGSNFSTTVPDIDRTDYLLCIGANPFVSNGSMMTAPNVRQRLRAIVERKGQLVVVDPRRTETAQAATEYISILPGTDAFFVLSLVQHLVATGQVHEATLHAQATGWDTIRPYLAAFAPERVSARVGIAAATIQHIAEQFAGANTSVAYSRMGSSTAAHSTLACYAVELLNLAAGRLGKVGGSMFPSPAIDAVRLARAIGSDTFGTYSSRVRGLPETSGELPATTLAEEMETPGDGQVRALLTYASNPVIAVPNGRRLQAAIEKLDFMVSVDTYVNETTRHAHLILPPASLLAEDYTDLFFANMAVHNVARWTPPVVSKDPNQRFDWDILLQLAERLGGGITGMPALDGVLRAVGYRPTPETIASLALRFGPYGDRGNPLSKGLNRRRLQAEPHGVDLGPLQPGFRRRIFHRNRKVQLAAEPVVQGLASLQKELQTPPPSLVLIGRRHLRSNNSWMHNLPRLNAGPPRCVLLVHPHDAQRLGLKHGETAEMQSSVHRGAVEVAISDEMRPGVVSLPHGYGHQPLNGPHAAASLQPGPSANDWVDDSVVDAIGGQSVLNGVPVELRPLQAAPNPDTR